MRKITKLLPKSTGPFMSSPRIILAGLFHETNTFADDQTGLDSFHVKRGAELLATHGDGSPLGAFVDFAKGKNWQLLPLVDYRATPSGMVLDEVVEKFWSEFQAGACSLLQEGVDAIYLVLHGAMVSESIEDVEGVILERIRALPGAEKIPIFGVTDLHGNFTERMARHANLLVTYRENPHTDAAESAVRAAELLARALETKRLPQTRFRSFPIVWPATGTATAQLPMLGLEQAARHLEKKGHWSVNVYAGFAFADIHDTGVSVAIANDLPEERTQSALDLMEQMAFSQLNAGFPQEYELHEAINDLLSKKIKGPVLIVEPGDNIGGGAPGDCTTILRAFIDRRLPNSAAIINDPEAVEQLRKINPGKTLRLAIGGKGSRLDPGPLELDLELIRLTDGVFELEDRQSHLAAMVGTRIEMGPCALVRHESTLILLTTHKTAPMDLGQWSSQGVDPRSLGIINVKAAVAHRRAYDKIAAASYSVTTPGPCSSNLALLPFRRIRRPIVPLDPLSKLSNSKEPCPT
jgi:microcystin degradation protein MlrC